MKPILEMNGAELLQWHSDKNKKPHPVIDDMKKSQFVGYSNAGRYSDAVSNDIDGYYRIENDILIFTVTRG